MKHLNIKHVGIEVALVQRSNSISMGYASTSVQYAVYRRYNVVRHFLMYSAHLKKVEFIFYLVAS